MSLDPERLGQSKSELGKKLRELRKRAGLVVGEEGRPDLGRFGVTVGVDGAQSV
ncbi:hypothetical protein ACIOGZ_34130 [Kitasatospora sp. NPDC088160]|uniref:hypothetical protein n=1 Tax=Kitasatospora sp. NPDC088160 TaxID=3364072 RepID=UPI00382E9E17